MSVQLPISIQEQNYILHVLLELLTKEQLNQLNKYNEINNIINKFYKEYENQIIILHANILELKDLIKCIKDVVSKKNNRFWLIDSIKSVREFLNYYQNARKIPYYYLNNLVEITSFIKYNYKQIQEIEQVLLSREIELCKVLAI